MIRLLRILDLVLRLLLSGFEYYFGYTYIKATILAEPEVVHHLILPFNVVFGCGFNTSNAFALVQ